MKNQPSTPAQDQRQQDPLLDPLLRGHHSGPTRTILASTPLGTLTISFTRAPNPKFEVSPLREPFIPDPKGVKPKERHITSDPLGDRIKAAEEAERKAASYAQKVEDDIRNGRFDN